MSELKHQLMLNKDMSWVPCYLKSEADKVIEEKDAEIARLNAIRKVHVEAIESMGAGLLQDEEEARHHKYKRCLAMAKLCKRKRIDAADYRIPRKKWEFYDKWYKLWLELAEKFKPKGGEVMCEYCENGKPLIGDEQDGACIENGNILVSYGECTDFAKGRINFCPQCGRNLAEDK